MDQAAPVDRVLSNIRMEGTVETSVLHSVDLSAATDRLPVDLQKDILNCLGLPGDA